VSPTPPLFGRLKRETASGRWSAHGVCFCFAHRATRPSGQCLLLTMAKEYVGYSGEEPSSPGHLIAAVTWEGKENVQAVSATSSGPSSAASKSITKGVLAAKSQRILVAIIFRRPPNPHSHSSPILLHWSFLLLSPGMCGSSRPLTAGCCRTERQPVV